MSIVEVLISVAILTMIFIAGASLYVQSGDTTVLVKDRSNAQFEAQEALERMVDEVRNCDAITAATANSFTLTRNLQTTTFLYSSQNKSILRNNVAYAKGISALSIQYFNNSGSGSMAAPTQVVRLDITITATTNGTSRVIKSSVNIRRKST